MKVALVHDWLTVPGGGEKVLESLHNLFPKAPIFTTLYNSKLLPQFRNADVRPSLLNTIPFANSHHQVFVPFMPYAVEHYNLDEYDLIISVSHACAKGAIKKEGAIHFCYCLTPIRYVWFPEIDPRASGTCVHRFIAKNLKKWDLETVPRVDYFATLSHYVQKRILNIYKRESEVIYPPVDVKSFNVSQKTDNFFLYVGRLVAYKKPEIVVNAFNRLGLALKIVGQGPEFLNLRKQAHSNIEFLGNVNTETLKTLYSKCLALIFPTIEDFGIVPVECMASGRPVIAYAEGGALETVKKDVSGMFFYQQNHRSLIQVIKAFKPELFEPQKIIKWAEQFDKVVFQSKIKNAILKTEEKK